MARILKIIVISWLLLPNASKAADDSPKRKVISNNKSFYIDANLKVKTLAVIQVSSGIELWSCPWPDSHYPQFVSDDGGIIVTVAIKYVRVDEIATMEAVTFRSQTGIIKSYRVTNLCPDPPRTQDLNDILAPVGEYWRTWYTYIDDEENYFTIHTTCGLKYQVRYSDGAIVSSRPLHWRLGIWFLVLANLVMALLILWKRRRTQL